MAISLPPASSSVRAGDVVLGRFGKNAFWPALASEISNGATGVRLVFFGDHKELLLTTPTSIAERIRPFADLNNLSYRERPGDTDAYRTALEEANRWHAAADTTPTPVASDCGETPGQSDWKIDGTAVESSLLLRAASRRLPKWNRPAPARTTPAVTFRVLLPSAGGALGWWCHGGGASSSMAQDEDEDEDEDDDASCEAFARRHEPLAQLEYNGFAAHPSVGAHEDEKGATRPPGLRAGSGAMPMLVMDGGSSCFASDDSGGSPRPSSSRSRNHRNYSDRGGPSSGSSGDSDMLIGRRVRVPALAFPSIVPSAAATTPYYDGKVMRISEGKRREVLEVYFSGDHTTCLFTKAQVRQWLFPDEGSKKKS